MLKGAIILFKDVLSLVRKKFEIKQENLSSLRFLHADELRILTKSDHVIY